MQNTTLYTVSARSQTGEWLKCGAMMSPTDLLARAAATHHANRTGRVVRLMAGIRLVAEIAPLTAYDRKVLADVLGGL